MIYDDLERRPSMGRVWAGEIADSVDDLSDKVHVIIPDLRRDLRIGPCRWQSRDQVSLPARGDRCLVIFDNNKEPWVAAWWPYDS